MQSSAVDDELVILTGKSWGKKQLREHDLQIASYLRKIRIDSVILLVLLRLVPDIVPHTVHHGVIIRILLCPALPRVGGCSGREFHRLLRSSPPRYDKGGSSR